MDNSATAPTFRKGQVIYTATHRFQVTKITTKGNVMAMATAKNGTKIGSMNYGSFADFAEYLATIPR